jgi:hypothetical protein
MPGNPADLVLRSRLRETVHFPDLTERRALRLSAIANYTARSHFGRWHKKFGGPKFDDPDGVFTPLAFVELEATDVSVDPRHPFTVTGETFLARTLDGDGSTRHLLREGRHTVADASGAIAARAHYVNVFTRYSADPARRRVRELPAVLGLGPAPSRVATRLSLAALLPSSTPPDFADDQPHAWHYGQTDANRHVNSMEYLRMMEQFVGDVLHRGGHDLARLYFRRARIVYRKPCFRGEAYRRAAWFRGEAPLVLAGAFFKVGDPPDAPAAAAVELTLAQHAEADELAMAVSAT